MKVALVFPRESPFADGLRGTHWWDVEAPSPVLGIAYLGAVLRSAGHKVELVDGRLTSGTDLRRAIEGSDLVGISVPSVRVKAALEIASFAKELGKRVVVGGPHPSIDPDFFLSKGCVDFAILGEGEVALRDLLEDLENPGRVEGVAFRSGGRLVLNGRAPIAEIDSLPRPAVDLLPVEEYFRRWKKSRGFTMLPIMTSRGCPFRCIFCSKEVFGHKYRAQSIGAVVQELETIQNTYHPDLIMLNDDLFTCKKSRVLGICEGINNKRLAIRWACEGRVDTLDEEMARAMSRAGCEEIWFGVESGSQRVLDFLRKGFKVQRIRSAVRIARGAGIEKVCFFIIIGTPVESDSEIDETIELVRETRPDTVLVSFFTPMPGTEAWRMLDSAPDIDGGWKGDYYQPGSVSGTGLSPEALVAAKERIAIEAAKGRLRNLIWRPVSLAKSMRTGRTELWSLARFVAARSVNYRGRRPGVQDVRTRSRVAVEGE